MMFANKALHCIATGELHRYEKVTDNDVVDEATP